VVANGAGAAGIAIIKLLYSYGVRDIIMCDTKGAIYEGRSTGMNDTKEQVAKVTNRNKISGPLETVIQNADVFIGVSAAGALTKEMVSSMNRDAIIFAMANPDPEIMPEDAKAAGAKVVGTGRSDFPNQVNNVLAFPGIFRGALDVRATHINEKMKVAAVQAIAGLIQEHELNEDYVIPAPFDERVASAVAAAVAKAAMETGVARINVDPEEIKEKTRKLAIIGKSEE
jgi:malate dehydrogenase (oxaloacetate-decarboxylating)